MNLTIPYLTPSIQDGELEFVKYVNFLSAMLDRRERSPRSGSNPIELTVDATLSCQLLCPYCETGSGAITRKPANLKAAFHDDLMNALGDTAFFVQYFSNGEPLLNKGLPAMIREHRRRETFSLISTNLSLPLSAERIDDLLTSGLGFICASVDGTTAESYQQYRVGGDFGLVVENIGKLVRRKQELGLTLQQGKLLVAIKAETVGATAADRQIDPKVREALRAIGAEISAEEAGRGLIVASVPASQLRALAAIAGVRRVEPVD